VSGAPDQPSVPGQCPDIVLSTNIFIIKVVGI
jgi:hypothetical protein